MHVLVYGSLRSKSSRGYNFGRLGPQKYLRTITLEGYALHDLGAYPAVCESPKGSVVFELHEVDDQTYERLTQMEVGASYHMKQVTLPEGPATIYMMSADRLKSRPKVESGDWV